MSERDTSFFQTVKEKADLEDYLTKHLNVELVSSGSGMMSALCPFHAEDTPSFIMNDDSDRPWKTWHCFGACQEGGTILDAVMKAEPSVTDVAEAAEFLNELYDLGLAANSEAYQRFRKTAAETRAVTEKAREEMGTESRAAKQAKAYLHNRGYTDATIDYFELGIDTSQTQAGRLSIPIYDRAGQPVSVANRALFDNFPCRACGQDVTSKEMVKRKFQADKAKRKGESAPFAEWEACPHCGAPSKDAKVAWLTGQNPKYLFIKDFDKARYLYNEHGARGPLVKDPEGTTIGLFLVEGYPDAWAGHQAGHRAICAYSGSVLSDEQAKAAIDLAKKAEKPIVLVPDFDETGQGRLGAGSGVPANIRKLNGVDPTVEVQVVHSIDKLTYEAGSETKGCKDLGEVLQHFGDEKVDEVLRNNRWPAAEWQIRQVVVATNPKTAEPFFSKQKEMELIGAILRNIQTRESLDHLIPLLALHWKIREEQTRNFFYSHLSSSEQASAQHLFKDIAQAQQESAEFLADANIIPLGFEELDRCFPGGGVRPGQLMMMLGKAQPLDAKVLTASGWKLMGEIQVGDEVVNPEGGLARVRNVFPQGERDIYRVTLANGASTECCDEHLWRSCVNGEAPSVRTLRELRYALSDKSVVSIPVSTAKGSGKTQMMVEVLLKAIEPAGHRLAQCIRLDSANELYITDDFIVTHNSGTGKTMLASQFLGNMADRSINCLFFSLEQGAGSFFPRLACQALDMPAAEVEELIKEGAPALKKVRELYSSMLLVDNVPTETSEAVLMTPGKVQSIIQEANLTHFEGHPVDVVIIDHLGILEIGEDAPRGTRESESAAPGWIMKELFKVCKATRVFMLVLQQLPKQVPSGVPFSFDAGWGGSQQTNFCDYIIQIWRPEQAEGLDETDRLEVEGQYKICLGKNRYGASALGHYFFDKTTLRILPPMRISQPKAASLGEDSLSGEDDEIMFVSPAREAGEDEFEAAPQQTSEAGATVAGLEALIAATPDTVPRDTQVLLDALGAVEEDLDPDEGDPFGDVGDDGVFDIG